MADPPTKYVYCCGSCGAEFPDEVALHLHRDLTMHVAPGSRSKKAAPEPKESPDPEIPE